jgi:hypothetical protein
MTDNKLKYNNSRMHDREWDETTNRRGFTPGTDDDLDFPITGSRTRWNTTNGYVPQNGYTDPNFHSSLNGMGTPYGTPYNNLHNTNHYNMMNTPYGFNRSYGTPFTNGSSFNGTPLSNMPFPSVYNTPWQTPNGNSWPTGTPYGSIYSHGQVPFSNTWVPGLPSLSTNGSPYSSIHTTPYTNQFTGFPMPGTWGTTLQSTLGNTPVSGYTVMGTPTTSFNTTNRGKGPKGYQRSNESITENICDLLCEDLFVDATDIEVVVDNCEVTLIGCVESREVKRYVEDLCESVSGVCNVENRLRVNAERFQTKSTTSTTTDSKTKRSTLTTASVS